MLRIPFARTALKCSFCIDNFVKYIFSSFSYVLLSIWKYTCFTVLNLSFVLKTVPYTYSTSKRIVKTSYRPPSKLNFVNLAPYIGNARRPTRITIDAKDKWTFLRKSQLSVNTLDGICICYTFFIKNWLCYSWIWLT